MKESTPIYRAVIEVGSQKRMASKLSEFDLRYVTGEPIKVTQQRVSDWVNRGYPPAEVCIAIERLTESKITRHDLRPDVFSPEAVA